MFLYVNMYIYLFVYPKLTLLTFNYLQKILYDENVKKKNPTAELNFPFIFFSFSKWKI